ncbi:MAG: fimbrillin family protein [Rikenellaceae bacterium]
MSRAKIFGALLLSIILNSCVKSDIDAVNVEGSDNQILFGMSADWTRASVVDGLVDIPSYDVYSYYTQGVEWEDATSTDLKPYFTSSIATPFTITRYGDSDSGYSWSYDGGARYWPAVTSNYLSFIAAYPISELSHSFDADSGLPKFSYTTLELATDNEDLVVDARYDLNSENVADGVVGFDFQHALSMMSFQVELAGELSADNSVAYSSDNFSVNGITIQGLYNNADLSINNTDDGSRELVWNIDKTSTTDVTAAQGNTFKANSDYNLLDEKGNFYDIMSEGKGVFLLPQDIDTKRKSAPTIVVRLRRSFYANKEDETNNTLTEIVYESEPVTIPSGATESSSLEYGVHYKLSITINLADLDEYNTPLTLMSEIMDWTATTVTATINHNQYIYSSISEISAEKDDDGGYYGDFQICTNYTYNLRVPHHREELDGTITSSRGFLYLSDDFNDDSGFISDNTNHVDEYVVDGTTYKAFVPTLISTYYGVDYEIVYATKDIVLGTNSKYASTDQIYEYEDGFNSNNPSPISGMTVADIVYGSNNGYAYIYNSSTELYRLLYLDPKNGNYLTAFNYINDPTTGYHEIQLSNFEDTEGKTVKFKINIGDITGSGEDYTFDFWVTRSTRTEEGLYTSTVIGDNSYGINKSGDDAVYTLRLSVNPTHLAIYEDDVITGYGSFEDIIGVERISNGGGMITNLFEVELNDDNDVIKNNELAN